MRDTFLKVYALYSKVLWFFAIIAGLCTFAIMWIIDINALSRKIFNWPLPAGVEMTQSLLPVVIMLPFGYAMLRRDHVNTVFFTQRLSKRTDRVLQTIWMGLGFLLFAAVTYGTFQYALRSYNMNEQVWGANIRFPLWPAKMAVSAGTLLLTIQCLLDFVHGILFDDESTLHETIAEHVEGHANA